MALYEVAVYNDLVKRAVADGDHADYSDDWADVHYIEISARNEADARRKILSKYPKERGFIIQGISRA
jgi:hypothetical protein